MQDINNIYKPKNHPQVNAPFKFVTGELNNTQHPYEVAGVNVGDLKPTQPFVDNDIVDIFVKKLQNGETLKPIWSDKDDNILDGHHRYAAHLIEKPDTAIPVIRLLCDTKTGMEVLNGIEEEFQKHKQRCDQSELLRMLSEYDDSVYIKEKPLKTKKEVVTAYKKGAILSYAEAKAGNFFSLQPISGYKPYEIELDSLFDTDTLDKKIGNSKYPPEALMAAWFHNIDIKSAAESVGKPEDQFIAEFIAEKARINGIDGIKYGNKLLQTIDEK